MFSHVFTQILYFFFCHLSYATNSPRSKLNGTSPTIMSALDQFSQEYIDHDDGPAMVTSCVAVGVLALLIVGLRLWARKLKGLAYGVEDWLIITCVASRWTDQPHYEQQSAKKLTNFVMNSP